MTNSNNDMKDLDDASNHYGVAGSTISTDSGSLVKVMYGETLTNGFISSSIVKVISMIQIGVE